MTTTDTDCDCRACETRKAVEYMTWRYKHGYATDNELVDALDRHFAVVLGEQRII